MYMDILFGNLGIQVFNFNIYKLFEHFDINIH